MVQQTQSEILELTKELIAIPSTHSRPEEIDRCADFIENWLKRFDIRSRRFDCNGIPTLAVMPDDSLTCRILLNAHFDVVEAEDDSLFHAKEENGRLYGRGAIDDKYGVALSLVFFKNYLLTLRELGKNQSDMVFGLLLTGDEEIGGADGLGSVIDRIDTRFFIVFDGGSPNRIVTKEKGILVVEMEASGKSAHAARPWLGENSFDVLVQDYLRIKELFPETPPHHWHKTMVLSQCHAGNGSTNMVPSRACATLDIRYTELDDPDEIIETLRKNVRSTIHVKTREPVFCGASSSYHDLLRNSCKDGDFCCEHGASDARYLAGKNIPGVIWGAEGEMSQHTEAEYLVIDSLDPLCRRLKNFLDNVAANTAELQAPPLAHLKN
jgi:succinyl-diaminopimelate desuccinylase